MKWQTARLTATLATLALWSGTALAEILEWADTTQGGSFFDSSNWTPAQPPVNGDTIVMGAGTYTATMGSAFTPGNMDIGAGAELAVQANLNWSAVDGIYANAGTLRFHQNDSLWSLRDSEISNRGVIEADGVTLQWRNSSAFPIANADGVIRAINGGVLAPIRWAGLGGFGFNLSEGTLATDAESAFIVDSTQGADFVFNDVNLINEGLLRLTAARIGTGGQDVRINLILEASQFSNTGTVVIEKTGDFPRHNPSLQLKGTTAFTNQGTLTIAQLDQGLTSHVAFMSSENSLINQGTINIVNPNAGLHVTTVGNAFTQTAGTVNLVNGGELRASQIEILGGRLAGDGVVTGNTTVAAAAAVAPGASIGTLTFNGDLTLAGTYALEIDKLLGTADLLAVQGILTLDGAILDISYFTYQPYEQSFQIATATGGILGSFANVISPANYSLSLLNNGTELWLAIPEPSSLALLALAGLGLPRRRRR